MKIDVYRDAQGDTFTLGVLTCGDFLAYTCEDTDRHLETNPSAKVYGKTAIPRGVYRVVLSRSVRFNKIMPEVLNVPGFAGIRIHSGNTHADTEGCLLVGMERDPAKGVITRSREAIGHLYTMIKSALDMGEKVYLEIH